jgi:hypothetical protein
MRSFPAPTNARRQHSLGGGFGDAKTIAASTADGQRRLRRLGFTPDRPAEHFYVKSVTGPLLDGEADQAMRWGQTLAGGAAP